MDLFKFGKITKSPKNVPTHGPGTDAYYKGDKAKILSITNGKAKILPYSTGNIIIVNYNSIEDDMYANQTLFSSIAPYQNMIKESYYKSNNQTEYDIKCGIFWDSLNSIERKKLLVDINWKDNPNYFAKYNWDGLDSIFKDHICTNLEKIKTYKQKIDNINESEAQDKYREFFRKKLEEYGVDSPSSLSDEDKSKFFSEIKSEWKKEKVNESLFDSLNKIRK